MRYSTRPMNVGEKVYNRITGIKARLEAERDRKVTYSEVLSELADAYEQQAAAGPAPVRFQAAGQ